MGQILEVFLEVYSETKKDVNNIQGNQNLTKANLQQPTDFLELAAPFHE